MTPPLQWKLSAALALVALAVPSAPLHGQEPEDLPTPPKREEPADTPTPNAPPESQPSRAAGGIEFAADERQGVTVVTVLPNSSAAEAGFRPGDIIRAINGRPVRSLADLRQALAASNRMTVQYERNGRLWRTVWTVPADIVPPALTPPAVVPAPARPRLGITVRTVDAALRRQLRLPTTLRGAMITNIVHESPAARYGLPLGGVITSINGIATTTADDVIGLIQQADLTRPIEVRYWDRGQFFRKRIVLAPAPAPLPRSLLELERQLESPADRSAPQKPVSLVELLHHIEKLEQRIGVLESRIEELEKKQPSRGPLQETPKPAEHSDDNQKRHDPQSGSRSDDHDQQPGDGEQQSGR